jgi:hypothetical protein
MVQIAYFTPNQISGGFADYLDCWNVDLYWAHSDLTNCVQRNQVEFRWDIKAFMHDVKVKDPQQAFGTVQAIFRMPADDYFLGIVKLSWQSAGPARVHIRIDKKSMGEFTFNTSNVDIPVVAQLEAGAHSLTVQRRSGGTFWFHSISCFQV